MAVLVQTATRKWRIPLILFVDIPRENAQSRNLEDVMSISPAKKLAWFVAVGTVFGLFCIILGAQSRNYFLLGAGGLAAIGGFSLILMAIVRQGSRK